jgi:hypothetical protein
MAAEVEELLCQVDQEGGEPLTVTWLLLNHVDREFFP